MKMNLAEAFALYGADVSRRASRTSAIAADGAIILGCSSRRFCRPAAGVLRYEDVLCDATGTQEAFRTLREHLELAQSGSLPVRLVIITETKAPGRTTSRTVHVRQDLVGSVVNLDDSRYVVDFVRVTEPD
jgi:hypothetical protein